MSWKRRVVSASRPFLSPRPYITAIYISVFRVSSFIRKSTLDDHVASSFELDRIQIRESSLLRAAYVPTDITWYSGNLWPWHLASSLAIRSTWSTFVISIDFSWYLSLFLSDCAFDKYRFILSYRLSSGIKLIIVRMMIVIIEILRRSVSLITTIRNIL